MVKLSLKHHFCCSHQLRLSRGSEALHSHRWRLKLYFSPLIRSKELNSNAFNMLRSYIKEIINPFEGRSIGSNSYFRSINPSTENMARFIFNKLEEISPLIGLKPLKVSLWETADSCASWIGE